MTERLQKVTQTYVDDETDETREVTVEYDEKGAAIPAEAAEAEAAAEETSAPASDDDPLPDNFPAKAALNRAGLLTYGDVEAQLRSRPLNTIEGVDALQAEAAQQMTITHKAEVVAVQIEAKKEADAKAAEEAEKAAAEGNGSNPGRTGTLPVDFPQAATLKAAGITTYEELAAYSDDFTQIEGIGDRKAAEISAAL